MRIFPGYDRISTCFARLGGGLLASTGKSTVGNTGDAHRRVLQVAHHRRPRAVHPAAGNLNRGSCHI